MKYLYWLILKLHCCWYKSTQKTFKQMNCHILQTKHKKIKGKQQMSNKFAKLFKQPPL